MNFEIEALEQVAAPGKVANTIGWICGAAAKVCVYIAVASIIAPQYIYNYMKGEKYIMNESITYNFNTIELLEDVIAPGKVWNTIKSVVSDFVDGFKEGWAATGF